MPDFSLQKTIKYAPEWAYHLFDKDDLLFRACQKALFQKGNFLFPGIQKRHGNYARFYEFYPCVDICHFPVKGFSQFWLSLF